MGEVGQQMQGGMVPSGMLDGLQKDRIAGEGAVLHRRVQPHVVLHDAPASPQIGVSGLGVAGLAGPQAHKFTGGLQAAPGAIFQKGVPVGGVGQVDGVALIAGAQAPAVADDEEHPPPPAPGVSLRQGAAGHLQGLRKPHDV